MPRTTWLLAAAAVLPLLVPASAVSHPQGFGASWITSGMVCEAGECREVATEISSAKVCGASECREVSDPEAATALAVGPRSPGTDAPMRELPWYKSTLTIRAEDARRGVHRPRLRHRGALRRADARGGRVYLGDPAQRERRGLREAHSRAYAPPGEDACVPAARVDEVFDPASAATPASDGSNVWIVALGGGVLAALMAGLLLWIRHRRASTPPAAPEAPGAA